MKKNAITINLIIILLVFQTHLSAQSFLNGGFEVTTATCNNDLPNPAFNSMMSNCYAFGNNSQIDIYNNTCIYGPAQQGNYFIALTSDSIHSLNDALSLALSTPMTAGNSYTITFYNRQSSIVAAGLLEIGYSTDSLSFGTAIDTAPIPTTSWSMFSVTFIPVYNAKYITLRTIQGDYGGNYPGYGWNFVDNFSIEFATNIISYDLTESGIQVFPNPTSGAVLVQTDDTKHFKRAIIRDLSGRILFTTDKVQIDFSQLAHGIYFLEVVTSSGRYWAHVVRE